MLLLALQLARCLLLVALVKVTVDLGVARTLMQDDLDLLINVMLIAVSLRTTITAKLNTTN